MKEDVSVTSEFSEFSEFNDFIMVTNGPPWAAISRMYR